MRLIDAPRCPYCARVRIALAEKGVAYETVEVDLTDRPAWLHDLNVTGKVPVLDDGFILPESEVIMAYLEERYPEPPLLSQGAEERALARLLVHRFDANLSDDYYALRRGEANDFVEKLASLEVGASLYSDIAYVPWVIRARDMLGIELSERLAVWLGELESRPSVAAEVRVVQAL